MSANSPEQSSASQIKRKATELAERAIPEAKKSKIDPLQRTMSTSSTSPRISPPSNPAHPQLPSRGSHFSPPPSKMMLHAMMIPDDPDDEPPTREATRIIASRHLKYARDHLIETMRVQGLKRRVVPAIPNSIAAIEGPVKPPPPSPPHLPTTPAQQRHDDGQEAGEQQQPPKGLGIAAFVGFGQGKQDWEVRESSRTGEELGSSGGIGVVRPGMTGYVEGTRKGWANEAREGEGSTSEADRQSEPADKEVDESQWKEERGERDAGKQKRKEGEEGFVGKSSDAGDGSRSEGEKKEREKETEARWEWNRGDGGKWSK